MNKRRLKGIDKVIICAIYILTFIGLLAISSATQFNMGEHIEVIKQLAFIAVGTGLMLIVAMLNFTSIDENLRNIIIAMLYVGVILSLVAVMIPGIGSDGGGASRWIKLGPVGIQPSEFAKIILILVTSAMLSMFGDYINRPLYLMGILFVMAVPVVLILIQPNLSTALIILSVLAVQLFIAEIDYRYIIGFIVIAIPLFFGMLVYIKNPDQKLLYPHQRKRILALLYPEEYQQSEAYQTQKSIQAIGSGKITGKGLYNGILNKANYVPESHTDFVLAVIGEEFGFLGTFIVLICQGVIAIRSFSLLKGINDNFIRHVVIGIASFFFLQTFVNIGVVVGILPNTGVTLPFVSAGGSSYLANMLGIGIILNIGIKKKQGYPL